MPKRDRDVYEEGSVVVAMAPYAKRMRRKAVRRAKGPVVVIPRRLQGYVRTSGNYGRYSGSGTRRPEMKFFDTIQAAEALDTTGEIVDPSFCLIAQGADEDERIGRKIVVKSIHLKGVVRLPGNTTAGGGASRVRVLLYWDKQCNGATAAILDIIETGSVNSFRNLGNKDRFVLLWDKTFTLNHQQGPSTAGGDTRRHIAYNKKVDIPIEYSGATNAITEIRSNNLGLAAIMDNGNAADIAYTVRIRYTDN